MGRDLLRPTCIDLHHLDPGILLRSLTKLGLELATWLAALGVELDENGAGVLKHLALE